MTNDQSTKDEITGKFHELKGQVKEKAGKVINNPDLEAEGQRRKGGGQGPEKSRPDRKSIRQLIRLSRNGSPAGRKPGQKYEQNDRDWILIVVGLVGLAVGGFNYTTREKVVDVGPIHVSGDKTHSVPVPPIAGAVALLGGIALLVAGKP